MVQMRDHNLCFDAKIWEIIHKLLYPFLSGALITNKCSAWYWSWKLRFYEICWLFYQSKLLKMYWYTSMLFHHFYKGDNLCESCFPHLGTKPLKMRSSYKERICSSWRKKNCSKTNKFFPFKNGPPSKREAITKTVVASPESVPFHLRTNWYIYLQVKFCWTYNTSKGLMKLTEKTLWLQTMCMLLSQVSS